MFADLNLEVRRAARFEVVCAMGGSRKRWITKKHSSSVSFTFVPTKLTWNIDIRRLYLSLLWSGI
jgi:hypothetical protein